MDRPKNTRLLTINVNVGLAARWKAAAKLRGKTLTKLILESMEAWLDRRPAAPSPPPPVVAAAIPAPKPTFSHGRSAPMVAHRAMPPVEVIFPPSSASAPVTQVTLGFGHSAMVAPQQPAPPERMKWTPVEPVEPTRAAAPTGLARLPVFRG